MKQTENQEQIQKQVMKWKTRRKNQQMYGL